MLWFNPFAHLALGAFRRDMEAACDSTVLAAVQPDKSPLYAETILRSATRPVPRSLCALTSLDELKGRLTMLSMTHGRGRKLAGFGIAAGLAATGLAITVPAAAGPQEEHEIVRKVIVKGPDGKEVITETKDGDTLIARPDCTGEKVEIGSEADAGAGKKEAFKIVLCGKQGESGAQLADGLAKALTRIEKRFRPQCGNQGRSEGQDRGENPRAARARLIQTAVRSCARHFGGRIFFACGTI